MDLPAAGSASGALGALLLVAARRSPKSWQKCERGRHLRVISAANATDVHAGQLGEASALTALLRGVPVTMSVSSAGGGGGVGRTCVRLSVSRVLPGGGEI